MEPTSERPSRAPWLRPLASLVLPGLGQVLQGEVARGIGLFVTVLVLSGLIFWQRMPILIVPLGAVWLWGVWDALQRDRGRSAGTTAPFLVAALIVYALGVNATELQPERLVSGWPNIQPILRGLGRPEFLEYPTEDLTGFAPVQVPCIDPLPEPARPASDEPRLLVSVACADMGETIIVEGEGFFPDFEGDIIWENPIGDEQHIIVNGEPLTFVTDAEGRFRVTFAVPTTAVPIERQPGPGETQTHRVFALQRRPYGSLQPTYTLNLVLDKIGETIALAFLATGLALVFAVPLSLLASRNLMWTNPFTRGVYYVVRTLLNVIRSIETLMWAIIFVVWVGLGPFSGTLALLLHSIAALGKLYSEAIEAIDPGPIEAARSTGAKWPQVVVYAVLPQFLPAFMSFTLFRWDINVRMATVIGLVSDAGLGFLVIQWIHLGSYNSLATAIIAVVLVVAVLDYTSAFLRQRIIEGVPARPDQSWLRRYGVPALVVIGLAALFVWSWGVAEIDLGKLVTRADLGLQMAGDFLIPEAITRPTEEHSVTAVLPVPCGSGEPVPQPPSGPRVNLSLSCAEVGDPLVISGHELPADTRVSVRWLTPDGAYLRIQRDCCDTDDLGNFRLETTVNPILEVDPGEGMEPGGVEVNWKVVIGGPEPSEALKTTLDLAGVTLLMALIATTLGSAIAIPLSFLAARNIMGRTIVGRAVYNVARFVFNLWRSIEPMILAVICASWVGFGPSAGVLALALNNIPNLGKLFSESIEEIDTGPVEAITSTGANRPQTLSFAIIPQIIPRFLAYILYQWDINIRMSTVIGFVGGGGIGRYFRQQVQLNQYDKAGMAVWLVVVMVWSMDYVSAKVRERLT